MFICGTIETTLVYLVSTTQKMFKQKFDWPNTTGKSSLTISPRLLGNAAVSQGTDHQGQQFWVVVAEREYAERFIVYADDMRTAFLELQTAIHRST